MYKTKHLAVIVHPKNLILSAFTHPHTFQTCMTYFLQQNTKDIILKNVGKETILATSDKEKKKTNGFLKISFYVPQKESHKGLKRHKGKNVMTEFEFLGELCL